MRKLLYLASPIDQANEVLLPAYRKNIIGAAMSEGWDVFDPSEAFHIGHSREQPDSRFAKINHRAMTLADGLIAILPKNVPTLGVPMELERMRENMPVIVWTDIEWSAALAHHGIWLMHLHSDHSSQVMNEMIRLEAEWGTKLYNRKGPLPIKLVGEHAKLPKQHYRGDAGFDLFASEWRRLEPGEFCNIPTGVYVELDDFHWGLLMGRSSSLGKRGLLVNTAVIDSGWRGELFFGIKNLNAHVVDVEIGERVAQFIPMQGVAADRLEPVQVSEVGEHERGQNGFGSSGV